MDKSKQETHQPVVQIIDAMKVYGTEESPVVALNHVHFKVYPQEFVAIMGTSGSGKSTMLNVLGTLDRLDGGQYLFEGHNIEHFDDVQLSALRSHKIGFVFQSFHLLPNYTAIENVELPMVYAKVPKTERRARAEYALARVGLADRGHHLPTQLSGGQQQRVSIARALVNAPSLLLADEPTGALDSNTTQEILNIFKQLNQEGVTIVLVTHDLEVGKTSRRIVKMKDARILSDEILR